MESKREQVWVGLFVIIAAALLIVTLFVLTGAFAGSAKTFHARFHNVAGLDQGSAPMASSCLSVPLTSGLLKRCFCKWRNPVR